jgi:hypothetical protein
MMLQDRKAPLLNRNSLYLPGAFGDSLNRPKVKALKTGLSEN